MGSTSSQTRLEICDSRENFALLRWTGLHKLNTSRQLKGDMESLRRADDGGMRPMVEQSGRIKTTAQVRRRSPIDVDDIVLAMRSKPSKVETWRDGSSIEPKIT